jgi:hypothetical protein
MWGGQGPYKDCRATDDDDYDDCQILSNLSFTYYPFIRRIGFYLLKKRRQTNYK